jgi:hypothetical protein
MGNQSYLQHYNGLAYTHMLELLVLEYRPMWPMYITI